MLQRQRASEVSLRTKGQFRCFRYAYRFFHRHGTRSQRLWVPDMWMERARAFHSNTVYKTLSPLLQINALSRCYGSQDERRREWPRSSTRALVYSEQFQHLVWSWWTSFWTEPTIDCRKIPTSYQTASSKMVIDIAICNT